jgi:hypothetical protein
VEKQDLRSVLRFFAEIASSMREQESRMTLGDAEAGPDLLQTGEESWAPSHAQ